MSSTLNPITVWTASDAVVIAPNESAPDKIVAHVQSTLSHRDMTSIVAGFEAESYEMVSTFVWTKAAAALKKQIATLGMEFVGEMLKRPDLNDDSDPATSIADHEVISLAEDLGIITATQGLRLKHALEFVNHYARLDQRAAEEEPMQKEEAIGLLKTCVSAILGQPELGAAIEFATFRRRLTESTLKPDDPNIADIDGSPYFFVRTTLSILLSTIKTAKGAPLEHAVGNIMVLAPVFWPKMRGPERWQVGQAYAEVNAAGNRLAAAGLKKALLDVRGFDYVPESLRSSTFTEAAARVLSAHFALNNFYNEEEPMAMLANLGTAIPMPAFAKCMQATLAVWLGNPWGHSFAANGHASRVLKSLRDTQWSYYLSECLPSDGTILAKLAEDDKPVKQWIALIEEFVQSDVKPRDRRVKDLLRASMKSDDQSAIRNIHRKAAALRDARGERR